MARNHKRKALYEVIDRGRYKSSYNKSLGRLRPQETAKAQPVAKKSDTALPREKMQWWRRPKILQLNAGRIEISMPYQLAIVILLVLILLILVAFRLGQYNQNVAVSSADIQKSGLINQKERDRTNTLQAGITNQKSSIPQGSGKVEVDNLTGNNRIVIQTYKVLSQLEPVKIFFKQKGIATEIRKIGDRYYLVTSNKYENPNRPGTDGYRAKQIIVELGANYKAQQGYETFGPRPFHDAYGMKFDN